MVPRHGGNKKILEYVPKINVSGQKTLCIWPKNQFFLRYAHITHLFDLRQTRLNGIIFSLYPLVTLNAFGFLVGARLATRWAVFWPRMPKMAHLGAENAIF